MILFLTSALGKWTIIFYHRCLRRGEEWVTYQQQSVMESEPKSVPFGGVILSCEIRKARLGILGRLRRIDARSLRSSLRLGSWRTASH